MLSVNIYNQKGEIIGKTQLDEKIFGVALNHDLVKQAVDTQMANARSVVAHSQGKGEVRGGGRKPWRQKGTGRARHGSIRSPLWKGGGVTFGPRNQSNYSKKMPKKMRNMALFSALSNKLKTNAIVLLDKIDFKNIKTKQAEEMLNKLPIKEGNILLISPKLEPKVELSFRNLSYMKTLLVNNLNIVDVLKYNILLFTKDTIKAIEEHFALKNETTYTKPAIKSKTKEKR